MLTRLKKEYKQLQKNPPGNISTYLVDNNYSHWRAIIFGPEGTLYEGGIFKLDITFTNDYPFKAPKVKFLTKVYHPNVSQYQGDICLDILKKNWSAVLSVRTALLSICSLLSDPNVDDPLNTAAARLYKENKLEYDIKVRNFVQEFATLDNNDDGKENLNKE